jgi:hypothetical protein
MLNGRKDGIFIFQEENGSIVKFRKRMVEELNAGRGYDDSDENITK